MIGYNIAMINEVDQNIRNEVDKLSKIKELRIKNGFTQEQLAEALGVSQPLIANWETGDKFNPPAERIKMICEVLHCSADELLGIEVAV